MDLLSINFAKKCENKLNRVEKVNRSNLMDELIKVAKIKNNWFLIAGICEKLKARTAENAVPARRIKEAADLVGYSANTLNRMVSVKIFLDSIKDKLRGFDQVDFGTLSFPSLEVVKRLYQVDADAGLSMLVKVADGEIKHKDLCSHYAARMSSVGGYSAGHAARMDLQKFQDVALSAIQKASLCLFKDTGETVEFEISRNSSLVDVVMSTTSLDKPMHLGILFEMLHHPEKQERFRSFIERSLSYGNFFDQYWIVFPDNLYDSKIASYINILTLYDKASYGVITIPWGEEIEDHLANMRILRSPTGRPVPDLCDKKDDFEKHIEKICS